MTDLSLDATRDALIAAAQTVIDNQDLLTKADQAIGDGDHGVGMSRGFRAFREAVAGDHSDFAAMLKAGGQAIMMTSGGASGVIFGTFFTGAAKSISGTALDGDQLAAALAGGLNAVQARGKAKPGDKTMVDALTPAVQAARMVTERGGTLTEVAVSAATAAEKGLEETKAMVATTGKAKSMGERSLGFIDPGALTLCLFLRSLARSVQAS
jgi:dihydroxyacetone kinase-like protein